VARAARLSRAFLIVTAGIIAGFSLYVGFIHAGVIRNPFGPLLQGDIAAARSDRPGLRVLFVGNSMTYYNDMPQMVESLARAIRTRGLCSPSRTRNRDGHCRKRLRTIGWRD
jgi:hypothetical protein